MWRLFTTYGKFGVPVRKWMIKPLHTDYSPSQATKTKLTSLSKIVDLIFLRWSNSIKDIGSSMAFSPDVVVVEFLTSMKLVENVRRSFRWKWNSRSFKPPAFREDEAVTLKVNHSSLLFIFSSNETQGDQIGRFYATWATFWSPRQQKLF